MRDLAICEDTAISLSIGFPLGSITYDFLGALQVFTQLRYASILFWNSLEVRRLSEVCLAAHDVKLFTAICSPTVNKYRAALHQKIMFYF